MKRRQALVYATCALAAASPRIGVAQPSAAEAEQALRKAFADYVAAWNSHDATSWSRWLTDDVEWVDVSDPSPKKTKATVAAFASFYVRAYELDLRIRKVALAPSGKSATLILEGKWLELPRKDGKYAMEWQRDLLVSRWRLEEGSWRLSYMNNHLGSAAEVAKAEGLN